MSQAEKDFESFLKNNHIKYKSQYKIFDIPFTQRHYHLVDFYLPDYDLYIEVKGFMTLFQINVLKYLLKYRKEHFYILQVTEEDWIKPYNKLVHNSLRNKLELNKDMQYKELLKLKKGNIDISSLQKLSLRRLNSYIKYRNKDINTWINS